MTPKTSSGDPSAAATPYAGSICAVAKYISVVSTEMFSVRPSRSGAVNWPRPSRSDTPVPYTSAGRSSGRMTRKKTPAGEEPFTYAASISSSLMFSRPALTKM